MSSNLKEKVRWYQAMLNKACQYHNVPLNGNHNDPITKNAMRLFQQDHDMKDTGYLTVASNNGLTQVTLEMIYGVKLNITPGKSGAPLSNYIKRFQADNNLKPDGKIGWRTREKFTNLLQFQFPFPMPGFHSQLGLPWNEPTLEGAVLGEQDAAKYYGILGGTDDRKQVNTMHVPYRWVTHLEPSFEGVGREERSHYYGSGILISHCHILTAAHNIFGDIVDRDKTESPTEAYQVKVIPAHDGGKFKSMPYKNFVATLKKKQLHYHPDWPTKNPSSLNHFNSNFDIGLIKLDEKIALHSTKVGRGKKKRFVPLGFWGQTEGYEIGAMTPAELVGRTVYTSGYPGFHGDRQYKAKGKVIKSPFTLANGDLLEGFENRFAYDMDTTAGQSGSPIWCKIKKIKSSGKTYYVNRLIGVVTQVRRRKYNSGVVLNEAILEQIVKWAPSTFKLSKGILTVKQ